MNDKPKRGRPRKQTPGIQVHISVDKDLFNAAHDPKHSITQTVERGLRAIIQGCEIENDLQCIGHRIIAEKHLLSVHVAKLARLRDRAKSLGVENIEEFEDSLSGWV